MMNLKKIVAVITAVGILGAAGAAFAAVKNPAEIASELTGKPVQDLYNQRAAGKTFGTMAKDAGKLDEFKKQMLEQRKAILDERVKEGRLTQKQADDIYNVMKNNQAICDGSGNAGIGRNCGAGFGQGPGAGMGMGRGPGAGAGGGNFGRGFGR